MPFIGFNAGYLLYHLKNFQHIHCPQLSSHTDHGPVLLDGVFGVMRFSPDGKYLMYAAEQKTEGKGERNLPFDAR